MSRTSTSSPTCGSFVLTIATRAAKTGVNGRDEAWARIIDLANRPFPRIKFSPNNSGTTCLIFETLTCVHQSCSFQEDISESLATHLVDHTVDTLPECVPAQPLVLWAHLVLRSLGLHRPQPRWWDVRASSPRRQHLAELCFRSCVLLCLCLSIPLCRGPILAGHGHGFSVGS